MAFLPNHHTSDKQAERANKRYLKAKENGTRVIDLIAKSGLLRSEYYRQIASGKTTPDIEKMAPDIEKMIADAVTNDCGTTPVAPTLDEVDDEELEAAAFRLNIHPPQKVYDMKSNKTIQLVNHVWTIT